MARLVLGDVIEAAARRVEALAVLDRRLPLAVVAIAEAPFAFLLIRLMIPAVPSARNSADGLAITSTRSIRSAGSVCSAWPLPSPWNRVEGLPSMRMVTLLSPRRLTFPCTSTSTDGMLRSASPIEPVCACRSLPTL